MFLCPRCDAGLSRTATERGVSWACPTCDGRAVALGVLRETAPRGFANGLWAAAGDARPDPRRRCPICTAPMVEVLAPVGPAVELDVCRACQFVWFDPGEHDRVPPEAEQVEPPPTLPPDPRWTLAMAQVELIAKRHRDEVGPEPDADWKFWPGLLGLPIEWEHRSLGRMPVVTWTLGALMTIVSLAAFLGDPRAAVAHLGLVPADPWRYAGLTLITSVLLHAGVLHLLGNLYFLLLVGDDVEDDLGRWPYVGLIAAGALGGDLLHGLFDLRPRVPLVGASAAISAMVVFYGLRFPHARLGLLLRFWFVRVRWIRFPVWAGLIGWLALQLLGARQQIAGFTNVSALGHLGGGAAGAAFWLRARPAGVSAPAGATAGPTDVSAWLGRDPRHRLAVGLIAVAALVVVLLRPLGLGVGTGVLFFAAQLACCYRFEVVDDWMWAFLAALLAFWFFATRGVPWEGAVALASAVAGFVVGYRVLRARDRALLED